MSNRSGIRHVLLGATLVLGVVAAGTPAVATPPAAVPVIVFVDAHPNEAGSTARAVADDHRAERRHLYAHGRAGFSASVAEHRLEGLRRDPRVEAVHPDVPVRAAGQPAPTGVQRVFATSNPAIPTSSTTSRVDATVAVLDTGLDADHPALDVTAAVDCTRALHNGGCAAGGTDVHGHGTQVAGAAAAVFDPDAGLVGVAPGARLVSVKVLDDTGSGWSSDVLAGVDWVTANAPDVDVANMSLVSSASGLYDEALARSVAAGVVYTVAAGNDAADIVDYSPAGHADVLTVSALADFDGLPGGMAAATCRAGVDDTLADFSNFGAGQQSIDVIAPGTCLRTTAVGGGVSTASGTSMAAPHVAGAAALLASQVDTALRAEDVAVIHDAIRDHGNDGWEAASDPDGTQEPLLDVSSSRFAPVVREHHEPDPPADPATPPTDIAGLVGYLIGLLGR